LCPCRKDNNKFQVNFSAFHSTYEVETPTCSARDLETHYQQQQQKEPSNPYHKKVSKFSIAVQSFFSFSLTDTSLCVVLVFVIRLEFLKKSLTLCLSKVEYERSLPYFIALCGIVMLLR
jgi:hypothetical protein